MIASILKLSRYDVKNLKITDPYSLHRVVYSLFDDVRTGPEKNASVSSGILYADKGGDFNSHNILLLSNREPNVPEFGELKSRTVPEPLLQHEDYRFEVILNPTKREKNTGKTVPIKGREQILQWFTAKSSESWGFDVNPDSLQINNLSVKSFEKKGNTITQGSATLQGSLTVVDREKFIISFQQGIGRGRAFGFGLLQVVPVANPFSF